MPDYIVDAGRELPFILILLALLGLRWRVSPRVSLFIAAPAEKVFALLDFQEGESQHWQRTRVTAHLIDAATRTYRLSFVTPLATGAVVSSDALFRVTRREAPTLLEVDRAGLDGKSDNNELLKIQASFTPQRGGTQLNLAYHWGPRPLLAQLLARTDLWGSVYRLKGMAETGVPDYRGDRLISAGVALVTGIVTLATFAFAFGPGVAILLVGALLFHEFGHLLAFRLIGQPWGRMVFLPFLGAVAVPRLAFATQAQSVFAALMGPAFSIAIPLAIALFLWSGTGRAEIIAPIGIVVAALNLFNLLPVEPLDGGVVLRSVLASVMGAYARFGLIAVGAVIIVAGFAFKLVLLMIFGGLAVVANIRPRTIDAGLEQLSFLQVTISAFGFVAVVAAYAALLPYLLAHALPGT